MRARSVLSRRNQPWEIQQGKVLCYPKGPDTKTRTNYSSSNSLHGHPESLEAMRNSMGTLKDTDDPSWVAGKELKRRYPLWIYST